MQIEHIEIAKLELQRGDILIVRHPPDWTMEAIAQANDAVKATLDCAGINVTVLMGPNDVDFSIVRKDAATQDNE